MGVHEFLPSQYIVQLLEGQLCWLQPSLCLNLLAAIGGFSEDNIDAKRMEYFGWMRHHSFRMRGWPGVHEIGWDGGVIPRVTPPVVSR